jgi:hypothetical protein
MTSSHSERTIGAAEHAGNYDNSALHDHYSSVSTVKYKNEGELMHK